MVNVVWFPDVLRNLFGFVGSYPQGSGCAQCFAPSGRYVQIHQERGILPKILFSLPGLFGERFDKWIFRMGFKTNFALISSMPEVVTFKQAEHLGTDARWRYYPKHPIKGLLWMPAPRTQPPWVRLYKKGGAKWKWWHARGFQPRPDPNAPPDTPEEALKKLERRVRVIARRNPEGMPEFRFRRKARFNFPEWQERMHIAGFNTCLDLLKALPETVILEPKVSEE